jgi:transcriptional regulator with XRE-family HTH domain
MPPKALVIRTRESLDISQAALGRLLNVHAITIWKWENSVLHPNAYQMALLGAFGRAAKSDPAVGGRALIALDRDGVPAALLCLLKAGA